MLDLGSKCNATCGLEGDISLSLVELKHLQYLDLGGNYFEDQPIPSFIGSLRSLKYHILHNSGFQWELKFLFNWQGFLA